MATILLVDDEEAVLEMLEACCQEAGYQTLTAPNGKEALRLFFQHHPDLVVADIRMPVMDGFDLISRIREVSEVPIIVLSALGREEEKVHGLRLGADDYIVKPVGMKELLARIEAALRRAQLPPLSRKGVYTDGVLTIHMERQEVYVRGQKVNLTPKELRLLIYLTQNAGRVVSVQELLAKVWGSTYYAEESVKWHIASLRRKIEQNPHEPRLIVTVWGSGYRYDKPAPSPSPLPSLL
ncbi:Transcriptional regulatory protein KdpE [bacterium HR23]|nr:Transcriptional regulatory protein KdpE [bacterium HR23]